MTIVYQGRTETSPAATLGTFLSEKRVDASKAIVEIDSEIYAPGSDLTSVTLREGSVVNVFRVVAGG